MAERAIERVGVVGTGLIGASWAAFFLARGLDVIATDPGVQHAGFRPSLLQRGCRHPERVLVGHPFNPPHLVPLVEIVGGEATPEDAVDRATLSEAVWAELGQPALTDGLKRKLIESVYAEIASVDLAAILADRDRLLVDLVAAKSKTLL